MHSVLPETKSDGSPCTSQALRLPPFSSARAAADIVFRAEPSEPDGIQPRTARSGPAALPKSSPGADTGRLRTTNLEEFDQRWSGLTGDEITEDAIATPAIVRQSTERLQSPLVSPYFQRKHTIS
ncbi:hypothetical protein [Streptomyces roseifaciens]|uniref:hypothetical protein n=1 Tax=Streptomyces roseifaciens TaxID=1488406 RepID=UPI0011873A2A|nr:hypothetical protein [Streptomyces roseifaciens]